MFQPEDTVVHLSASLQALVHCLVARNYATKYPEEEGESKQNIQNFNNREPNRLEVI